MIIREGTLHELDEIMDFYDMMCGVLGNSSFLPEGNKGGFPPKELVIRSIQNHQLFVGEEDGKVMAAYIMNHESDDAYDQVTWQVDAKKDQVSILHALRVSPDYGGHGYSKKLVEHAIEKAKENGQKAIRLDCIEGNSVPQKMYMSYGFRYIDTVDILYEDIGCARKFLVYELLL